MPTPMPADCTPALGVCAFNELRCTQHGERLEVHNTRLNEHSGRMHKLEVRVWQILVASALLTSVSAGVGAYLGTLKSAAAHAPPAAAAPVTP